MLGRVNLLDLLLPFQMLHVTIEADGQSAVVEEPVKASRQKRVGRWGNSWRPQVGQAGSRARGHGVAEGVP